ncbi:MAG: ribonuclease T2 [Burkholderiales bacterium]|nr:ribonuclease T2 [Burkholderiales bacterium]
MRLFQPISLSAICAASTLAFSASPANATTFDYFLLASSWQPGFCATVSGKPECKNLVGTHAATNLDMHGLWPNAYDGNHPYYCGVSAAQKALDTPSTWCSMAAYGASASTINNLSYYMPGVQSCLDKHEWYKHGSCASIDPNTYWQKADSLIAALNTTTFNSFVRNNAGKMVTRAQLLSAFTSSFGAGSGAAVALQCSKSGGTTYFTEVWINLDQTKLAQFPAASSLILDGSVTGTCPTTGIYIAKAK